MSIGAQQGRRPLSRDQKLHRKERGRVHLRSAEVIILAIYTKPVIYLVHFKLGITSLRNGG